MTKQEKIDWDELYEYVRFNVLEQDKNTPLSKHFVLRLKGLRDGKFMSNKKTKSLGSYSYKEILVTFKVCKDKIKKGLHNKKGSWTNEQHKINYIMVIVESNINDIKRKVDEKKKQLEDAKLLDVTKFSNEGAEYKKKGKKVNDNLKNLL